MFLYLQHLVVMVVRKSMSVPAHYSLLASQLVAMDCILTCICSL